MINLKVTLTTGFYFLGFTASKFLKRDFFHPQRDPYGRSNAFSMV